MTAGWAANTGCCFSVAGADSVPMRKQSFGFKRLSRLGRRWALGPEGQGSARPPSSGTFYGAETGERDVENKIQYIRIRGACSKINKPMGSKNKTPGLLLHRIRCPEVPLFDVGRKYAKRILQ